MAFLWDFIYSQLFVKPGYPTTSFAGRTVIVTGANVGLGFEASKHFARLGASRIILAVRSLEKGEAAKSAIVSATSCSSDVISVWQLDLASYASVKSFADRCNNELDRIDILLENAGVVGFEFSKLEDNERMITVNVVSTFLLALLLLPKLKSTATQHNTRPVLTIVTSEVHAFAQFPERNAKSIFGDLNDEKIASDPKRVEDRYPVSKLLEVFAVRELAILKPREAYPVTINCVNPGFCLSEFRREGKFPLSLVFWFMDTLLARTTEVGSRTLVDAASKGPESHGMYLSDTEIKTPGGVVIGDDGKTTQSRVWAELSEKLEKIQPGIVANI